MISKDYVINDPQGIHARPATALIRLTKNFNSNFSLKKGDRIIGLNSMINLLSMAVKGGETISIIIDGEDEVNAASAVEIFFAEQFK
jgi:phosphocarrier protein HPr